MLYKRHEYFRHSFNTPLNATFRILVGERATTSNPGNCMLLDISPGGSKIVTDFNIPTNQEAVSIMLSFTLFKIPIETEGHIVWKTESTGSFHYGIEFVDNSSLAKLIVDELKLRRWAEIGSTNGNKGLKTPT